MIVLLIFLFILGILIVIHELGHFAVAKKMGVRVEEFCLGFGPQLFSKKKNNTQYSVNIIPLGGYVKLAGDSLQEYKGAPDEYLSKPPGARAAIIFCGSLCNYIMGILCFWLIFFAGYPTLTTKVGGLIDGFGAKDAGIQVGDRITAIDGKRVEFWEDLQKIVNTKNVASKVKLSVLRDSKVYTLKVQIKEKELTDILGKKRNVGLLGITPGDEIVKVRHGLAEAFTLALKKTKELTLVTYEALWRIIIGKSSIRDSVTGPLGMFYITSKLASLGIIPLIHFVAILSLSLAIFNLLPLPILDGGHLVLLGLEKIRGRGVSLKTERIITKIGVTMVVILAVFVTFNDILRLFGDKITKFFAR